MLECILFKYNIFILYIDPFCCIIQVASYKKYSFNNPLYQTVFSKKEEGENIGNETGKWIIYDVDLNNLEYIYIVGGALLG